MKHPILEEVFAIYMKAIRSILYNVVKVLSTRKKNITIPMAWN